MIMPKFIENEFGDSYGIESYENGKFILSFNDYFYSYLIESGDFTRKVDGLIVSSGVKSKCPEQYREWYRNQS
jgi:hypothetical protein